MSIIIIKEMSKHRTVFTYRTLKFMLCKIKLERCEVVQQ